MIFARDLAVELERDRLTRQQLADRHGISLDRVIQWLALLKLPAEKLEEIAALGDYREHRVVTERGLRRLRQRLTNSLLNQMRNGPKTDDTSSH